MHDGSSCKLYTCNHYALIGWLKKKSLWCWNPDKCLHVWTIVNTFSCGGSADPWDYIERKWCRPHDTLNWVIIYCYFQIRNIYTIWWLEHLIKRNLYSILIQSVEYYKAGFRLSLRWVPGGKVHSWCLIDFGSIPVRSLTATGHFFAPACVL